MQYLFFNKVKKKKKFAFIQPPQPQMLPKYVGVCLKMKRCAVPCTDQEIFSQNDLISKFSTTLGLKKNHILLPFE
jgi:hypothetical protein